MLKIFTGRYKGRKLKTVDNPDIRPTTAKVKLSFFDIVQEEVREAIFLDGFGGTGNIGIEALSRGAEYVVFIEQSQEFVKILRQNLDKIGIPTDHYRIIKGDYNRTIIKLGKDGFKFDMIFLDPPYELLTYANPVKVIFKRDILKENGFIILERPVNMRFDNKYFHCFRTQKIGNKCLDFFRHFPKPTEEETAAGS